MVTIKSAAEILGVSVETLRNWDRQGKLTAKRDPENGYRLYNISKIQEQLKKHSLKTKNHKRAKLAD